LEALEIPVPNPIQQVKIVHDIESRLSVCEKIEETIESSLQQAEGLRLSIIKKAFEGKLVPQDPNDEPAEQLLERIRAAKGKPKPGKKEKVKMEKKPTQKRKEKIEI
jgi:type I restriction enzyme S subunit